MNEGRLKEVEVSQNTLAHPECRQVLFKGANVEFQEKEFRPEQMKELYEQTKNQKENVQQEALRKASSDLRWRLDVSQEAESNARLVEWEDGSFSLLIGGRHYEVNLQAQANTRLFTHHHSDALLSQQTLPEKASLRLTHQ